MSDYDRNQNASPLMDRAIAQASPLMDRAISQVSRGAGSEASSINFEGEVGSLREIVRTHRSLLSRAEGLLQELGAPINTLQGIQREAETQPPQPLLNQLRETRREAEQVEGRLHSVVDALDTWIHGENNVKSR